jgi:hypothetical protein
MGLSQECNTALSGGFQRTQAEVGEGAIMPTIPAILNAVYDATGIRFQELPLTPERVFTALRAKEQKCE